jgi:hypothetical protein
MAVSGLIGELTEKTGDLIAQAIAQAYERGFRDGLEAAKDALDKVGVQSIEQATERELRAPAPKTRHLPPAPPARARPLLLRVLAEKPGSAIVDLQSAIKDLDPHLARSSIASELHRQEGKLYRKEGRRWYTLAPANGVAT